MNTEELEKLLRKVVREEVEAEAERTRRENTANSTRVEARLSHIEGRMKDLEVSNTRLEKGQEQTNKRLSMLEAGQTQTHKQLNQLTEDMKEFFHGTWEKMETANERITRLEETAALTHKN